MNPFQTEGFQCRGDCADWTPALLWFQNAGDLEIWGAYMVIPLIILFIAWRRKLDLRPFLGTVTLFGAFIFGCGMTHFSGFLMSYWPAWWWDGIVKHITAALSWMTVANLCWTLPRFLDAVSPKEVTDAAEDLDKRYNEFVESSEDTNLRGNARLLKLRESIMSVQKAARRVERGDG